MLKSFLPFEPVEVNKINEKGKNKLRVFFTTQSKLVFHSHGAVDIWGWIILRGLFLAFWDV